MWKRQMLRNLKFTQWLQLSVGNSAWDWRGTKERGESMGKNVIQPVIFAVSGYKNTGKTTLITGIIPILTEKGYQVAVIKHDGHEFESDVPGTDSYQHQKAGAYGTAVFSKVSFLSQNGFRKLPQKCCFLFFRRPISS